MARALSQDCGVLSLRRCGSFQPTAQTSIPSRRRPRASGAWSARRLSEPCLASRTSPECPSTSSDPTNASTTSVRADMIQHDRKALWRRALGQSCRSAPQLATSVYSTNCHSSGRVYPLAMFNLLDGPDGQVSTCDCKHLPYISAKIIHPFQCRAHYPKGR